VTDGPRIRPRTITERFVEARGRFRDTPNSVTAGNYLYAALIIPQQHYRTIEEVSFWLRRGEQMIQWREPK
jgi:hypothetical protein